MKGKTKRKFTTDFKLKVVLEVLKEKDTLATISKWYELHPNQISDWKKQFIDAAPTLFETTHKAAIVSAEPDAALLYEQIGRLQMELTFLKKSCPYEPGLTLCAGRSSRPRQSVPTVPVGWLAPISLLLSTGGG